MDENFKKLFPWFKYNKDWTYLDSSATSLKPKSVIDAEMFYYEKIGVSLRNKDSTLSTELGKKCGESRQKIAKFFNANTNEIIFTSGATESLNLIANGLAHLLTKKDEIALSYAEHSSALLPWMNTNGKIVYCGKLGESITADTYLSAITKSTKILSFTHVSNSLGFEIDVKKIVTGARKINPDIIIIMDATQSVMHCKIDFKKMDIDFFVCSMHKLFGPTGMGILCGKYKLLEKLSPLKLGGGMVGNVENSSYELAPIPDRFEGGTPNIAGVIGSGAAIDFINKIGFSKIIKHESELKRYIDKKFQGIKGIVNYTKDSSVPIISFNFEGVYPQDLSAYLGHKKIICRSGLACTKLSHNITGEKSGFVRASFALYNDKKDVDTLIDALKKFDKKTIVDHLL